MLTSDERQELEARVKESFEKYQKSKENALFRWLYRYHTEYLKDKRLLILDDMAGAMLDMGLTNKQVFEKLDALVDQYEASFSETP